MKIIIKERGKGVRYVCGEAVVKGEGGEASEVAQGVKGIATMADYLSQTSGIHLVKF